MLSDIAFLTTRRSSDLVDLEANGLMSALQELAVTVRDIFRINGQFYTGAPVLIADNDLATHLFRIAQVAVSNAVKHRDRKSTRLNSSHLVNSYAVFCWK